MPCRSPPRTWGRLTSIPIQTLPRPCRPELFRRARSSRRAVAVAARARPLLDSCVTASKGMTNSAADQLNTITDQIIGAAIAVHDAEAWNSQGREWLPNLCVLRGL